MFLQKSIFLLKSHLPYCLLRALRHQVFPNFFATRPLNNNAYNMQVFVKISNSSLFLLITVKSHIKAVTISVRSLLFPPICFNLLQLCTCLAPPCTPRSPKTTRVLRMPVKCDFLVMLLAWILIGYCWYFWNKLWFCLMSNQNINVIYFSNRSVGVMFGGQNSWWKRTVALKLLEGFGMPYRLFRLELTQTPFWKISIKG